MWLLSASLKKTFQAPSLSEVSRNLIVTAMHWTERVDPDSRQTGTALPAAKWNCRNEWELSYKIISLCLRFVSLNFILFIRQVLLRIVVWNETLQSVTRSRQRHSYILKVLLKFKKQKFSKHVVCVLCSGVRVGRWVCRWVAVGVSASGCSCVGEWL